MRRKKHPSVFFLGIPGKVVKDLGPGSADGNRITAANYVELARAYRKG